MSQTERIVNVIRLQFVNRQPFLWVPLMVFGFAIALSLVIYAIIPESGPKYGGASQAPMWSFLFVGVSAMTLTFPFSQSVGLARWEFYLGSLAAAAVTSAVLATALVIQGVIEQVTDGYGMGGFVAYLPWVWESGWWSAWLTFFVFTLMAFVLGFWGATVFKRWGMTVLVAVLGSLGLALAAVLLVISRREAWGEVIAWFATAGSLQLTGWLALLTAVLAGLSYLTLRRAVP
ncbi:hypothetical protein [Brevibacterium luteolum]|uniref:Uncharacterized protein n=1 Tax=Brevibacterium luteolum TaxID=199591 RepID=A0A6G8KZN1_9MICO|nr:hypothetical protein [Brevibacterium luteolum]QIN30239.1 hypothetical protein EW640_13940 [Brevibacterium luteolum]